VTPRRTPTPRLASLPWLSLSVPLLAAALVAGCDDGVMADLPHKKATVFGTDDLFDVPANGLTAAQLAQFKAGDDLFDLPLFPADGLGPLYTRTSCSGCHDEGMRGPGLVQKVVIVEADGWSPAADQSQLPCVSRPSGSSSENWASARASAESADQWPAVTFSSA